MLTIILAIAFLGLALAGIATRILLKKGGEFRGTCSSNNPYMQKSGESCPMCGKAPEEECKGEQK